MTTRPPSILICDDEAELAAEIAEFLESCGWQAHSCDTGRAAERKLRDGLAPDCILTDLRMADLDGRSLIAAARALPPAFQPRVIAVMTGHVADQFRAEDIGADILYLKPIDPDTLSDDLTRRTAPALSGNTL